jgi:hypothetical protein
MQTAAEQKKHGRQKCSQGDEVEHQGMPHERNVAANLEKFHV